MRKLIYKIPIMFAIAIIIATSSSIMLSNAFYIKTFNTTLNEYKMQLNNENVSDNELEDKVYIPLKRMILYSIKKNDFIFHNSRLNYSNLSYDNGDNFYKKVNFLFE